jgi:GWxTD domain-containing protein
MSALISKSAAIFLFVLISCGGPLAGNQKTARDDFFSSAQAFYDSGTLDSSLVYLHKCLDIDRKFAPAHHLLGKIYLQKDGIYNRRLSALALKEAVLADQDNPEYHYALGVTLQKQGFAGNALEQFREAARLDSSDSRPLVHIAALNEKLALRYDDDRYFRRAMEASARAAALSNDPEQFFRQAAAMYQMGDYDSASRVLTHAVDVADSARIISQCYLLLGAIQVLQKSYDSAEVCFKAGRTHIGPIARGEMDDVRYLMTGEQYRNYMRETLNAQDRLARQFWGELDPDPTTEINERRLEHYARYVHAELTFSLPDRHISGWKTKRGELYIRYGPPTEQTFSLGDSPGDPPRWTWVYERFGEPVVFFFEDSFLNGEFNFPFPNKNWTAEDYANDPGRLADILGTARPQDFDFAAGTGPLEFLYMPRQFKGHSGRTDLEVFVAIPHPQLTFSRDGEFARAAVLWRQVLRYPSRQLADSASALRTYSTRAAQIDNPTIVMSSRMALSQFPESLLFAISISDTLSGHSGLSVHGLRLRNFYTGQVEISDVVLARRVDQPPGELSFRRDEVGIYSNLDNRYFASEPIWLYFETYNLALGPDGRTSYAIKQIISERRTRNVVGIFRDFVAGRDLEEVVTTYEGSGLQRDENRVLRVDVSEFPAGDYSLTIEIEDLISGRTTRASEEIVLYR